ncbi:exonuclease SbcCD subunit D [Helcobacillus massiliensis]|uniref:Nuclease SbcCD subunit D n=1 Tax=Helcobacillus massiliensis TaxID=521392 RepID=A0A839R2Q1_9MICO|nr:exonuclease SbcCD subunit D [Helcobacillus massiliensis]MBB3023316.1 exonuclease SbcD [Helcobacillus massiliensis]
MKILHTSDWHLGRTLHGEDLHEHQRTFHDFLVDLVKREKVDVVAIAGDVYDRSIPPVASVDLLNDTLTRLADITTVILTPGNHDSAARLGFGAKLMGRGVHILSETGGVERPVTVADEHGEVLFFGLPYLDPDIVRFAFAAEGEQPLARSHESVTREAMDRVRRTVQQHGGARSVVLAHTFVSGGEGSDSERDLTIGGVDSVTGSVFAGVDYVALGHLHGCQNMAGHIPDQRPAAWYSGSPLPFSFSEKNHRKAVLIVDMGADGSVDVTPVPTPVPRRLIELTGDLDTVLAQAGEHGDDWVFATVQEPTRPPHMQEKLRRAFPHMLGCEFVSTVHRDRSTAPLVSEAMDAVAVVGEFYQQLAGAEPTHAQVELIEQAVRDARAAHDENSQRARA